MSDRTVGPISRSVRSEQGGDGRDIIGGARVGGDVEHRVLSVLPHVHATNAQHFRSAAASASSASRTPGSGW